MRNSSRLIITMLILPFILPSASAQISPEVTLSLSPPDQEVDASSSDAHAEINGTVSITGIPFVTYMVNITADAEEWNASVEPSQLRLKSGESGSFVVTVTVPAGTIGGLMKVVTVNATATSIAGRGTASAWANVTCKQIFSFTVEQSDDEIFLTNKNSTSITLTVKNTGNGPDSFTLKMIDVRDFIKKGLRVRTNRSVVSLMPSSSCSIAMTFSATDKASSGDYEFRMMIYSRTAKRHNQTVEQELSVLLHVKLEKEGVKKEENTENKKTPDFTSASMIALVIALYLRRRL